mmetsp:Transcript_24891/g.55138  ORF Transcript_24891/g.55138 Transcript_24891/m.55138 type:complete len:205 (-) Transcript_24891:31-645(-)
MYPLVPALPVPRALREVTCLRGLVDTADDFAAVVVVVVVLAVDGKGRPAPAPASGPEISITFAPITSPYFSLFFFFFLALLLLLVALLVAPDDFRFLAGEPLALALALPPPAAAPLPLKIFHAASSSLPGAASRANLYRPISGLDRNRWCLAGENQYRSDCLADLPALRCTSSMVHPGPTSGAGITLSRSKLAMMGSGRGCIDS